MKAGKRGHGGRQPLTAWVAVKISGAGQPWGEFPGMPAAFHECRAMSSVHGSGNEAQTSGLDKS
jgi:hypothetical protein